MNTFWKLLAIAGLGLAASTPSALAGQDERKPPSRPSEPFRIQVTLFPDLDGAMEASVREAEAELEKRLGKNERWFRLVPSAAEPEIVVRLRGYWMQEERRVRSVWGVVSPVEDRRAPDKTQIVEMVSQHTLEAEVEILGRRRAMTGLKVKKNGGGPKDPARDLAKELERYCKEKYWELHERRKAHEVR